MARLVCEWGLSEWKRRTHKTCLRFSCEQMEAEMHSALRGTTSLSKFFVGIRRYTRVRKTAKDLEEMGFKSVGFGGFTDVETKELKKWVGVFATAWADHEGEDMVLLLPNDPDWGDGPRQAATLLSWLKLKLKHRTQGRINAELQVIYPYSYLAALPEEVHSAVAAMSMGTDEDDDSALEADDDTEERGNEDDGTDYMYENDQDLDDNDVGASAREEQLGHAEPCAMPSAVATAQVVVAPVMPMAGHTGTAAGGGAQCGGGEKRRGGEQRGGGRKHARVRPLKRRCVSTEDAHDRSDEL